MGTAGLGWISGTRCSALFGRDDVGKIGPVAKAGSEEELAAIKLGYKEGTNV